jgi:hypothetical protein
MPKGATFMLLRRKDKEMQKILEYIRGIESEVNFDRLNQWLENTKRNNSAAKQPPDLKERGEAVES